MRSVRAAVRQAGPLDTWVDHDLPVPSAAVALVDEMMFPDDQIPCVDDIMQRTGLDFINVARALIALDGDFLS